MNSTEQSTQDKQNIVLFPYFTNKDITSFILVLILFVIVVYFYPRWLMHPENFVPANPLVTKTCNSWMLFFTVLCTITCYT